MGIVTSVLGKNAVLLSSYAASLGLDCPVEARTIFSLVKVWHCELQPAMPVVACRW